MDENGSESVLLNEQFLRIDSQPFQVLNLFRFFGFNMLHTNSALLHSSYLWSCTHLAVSRYT